ncbi:hypothetical protein C0J52_10148 [Blattella germanica]|nr:hypothetical protein C0J52_10148 [Blattella germanica]
MSAYTPFHRSSSNIDVTVLNTAKDPLHVVTKMMECCSIITSNDTDCKFMKAMGGDMGLVNPREKRNLTFVYGNLVSISFHNKLSYRI